MSPKSAFRILTLAGLLVSTVSGREAAAQSATGSVAGTAVDKAGAALPGATVTLRNLGTASLRVAVSAADGSFRFPALPVGPYELSAELSGFRSAKVPNVAVQIGSDISLKVTLELANVTTEIVVTSETPLVETTRSQVSSVVNQKLVESLPTNGRNFIDFVLTTPGVVKDTRQGDISFAGQRGTLNSLVVDGADNNNTFFGQALGRTGTGRAPYQFSQDAVQEFQVNSNAYTAEYGRAGGAVINVVTKSGTNDFHGSAFYFGRDKSLRANDYIDEINNRTKAPYKFDQFGASLGGPIVKDKVFFFANYDGQRNTLPNTVVLGVPQGGFPTDAASQSGLAKLRAVGDSWERAQNQDVFLAKIDAEVGANNRLSLRYNRQEFTGQNFENGGITNGLEHTGDALVKTDTLTASFTSTFSQNLFNELRGQYARDSEPGLANSANPEATVREGGITILTIGRNNFSPRETTINRYQIADSVTFLVDKHTVKAGFDFNRDLILNYFPGFFSGSYTFNTLASFDAGRPATYQQNFAGPGTSGATTHPDLSEIALFVQDEFRVASNVTINAGLRYDRQGIHQPDTQNPDAQLLAAGIDTSKVHEDGNNLALRLGFAWTPKGSEKTVVRGGYGFFYGRTPAIMIGTAHSNNGINVQSYTFTGASVPTYPNSFSSIPTGAAAAKPSIFYFDPDYQNPALQQGSLGVEHALTNDLAVGLSYLHVSGHHLSRSIDANVGGSSDVVVTDTAGHSFTIKKYDALRPYANFARVIDFQSTGDSNYNGLTLEFNKRYSNHWQARVAYTWSKVLDTKPDATAVVPGNAGDDSKYAQDPLDLQGDYGVGDADVTHRFVASGIWTLDYAKGDDFLSKWILGGWAISGIVSYSTGQPYSATASGTDLNNDGNRFNDRAPGFGRNTFRLPSQFSIDPRVTKEFDFGVVRLQLIAEAFNLLNRSNVSAVRTQYYGFAGGKLVPQTSFGTPTTSSGPRTIQLAAKVIF